MLVDRIRRQQLGDVHLEIEEVADGIVVFGPVETMERVGASRVRLGGSPVELRLQPHPQAVVRRCVGARPGRRRHRAGPKLPYDLLPNLGFGADVGQIDRVEAEIRRAQPLVVAGDAVPIEERPVIGGRPTAGGLGSGRARQARDDDNHEAEADDRRVAMAHWLSLEDTVVCPLHGRIVNAGGVR